MTELVEDLNVAISGGEETLTLAIPDTISKYYGNLDGFSLCGERTYSIDGNTFDSFLEFDGDKMLTITSDDENDVPQAWYPTLNIILNDYTSVMGSTQFTA